jgi:hypothetical protein
MIFPSKWSIPKSIVEEGKIVGFETENQNQKGISFVASVDESEISKTLSKITKIIKINKEKELKEKLFKEAVEQLKSTFEKNDLDKLRTILNSDSSINNLINTIKNKFLCFNL